MFGSEKSLGVAPRERPVFIPLRLVANLSREHKGKNMAKFHYMPLVINDYIADTTHLTTQEHGAYLLLLMAAWRTPDCNLPNDDKKLARYAGLRMNHWLRIKDTIMEFWTIDGDKIFQKGQTKVRFRLSAKSDKATQNINARWLKTKETTDTDVSRPYYGTDTIKVKDKEEKKEIPKGISKEIEKKQAKGKGERLPEKWWPEDKELNFAIEQLGEVKAYDEIEKFRDHWAAAPGTKGRKSDWPATWRNWIRRQPEFNPNSSRGSTGPSDIVAAVSATVPLQSGKSRLRSNKIHHDPGSPGEGLPESGGAVGGKLGAIATRFDQVGVDQDEGEDSSQEHDNGRNHAAIYNLHG